MIFVNSEVTMGSKSFALAMAELLRPELKKSLTEDEFDNFELGLMQDTLYLDTLEPELLLSCKKVIARASIEPKFKHEQETLLSLLNRDKRLIH